MSMQIDVNVIKDNNAQMKAHDRPEECHDGMIKGHVPTLSPIFGWKAKTALD